MKNTRIISEALPLFQALFQANKRNRRAQRGFKSRIETNIRQKYEKSLPPRDTRVSCEELLVPFRFRQRLPRVSGWPVIEFPVIPAKLFSISVKEKAQFYYLDQGTRMVPKRVWSFLRTCFGILFIYHQYRSTFPTAFASSNCPSLVQYADRPA